MKRLHAVVAWLTQRLVRADVPLEEIKEHLPRYPHAGTFISEAERRKHLQSPR
jgi:ferric-dicitrate binding protein FerR (iron transport regulator)